MSSSPEGLAPARAGDDATPPRRLDPRIDRDLETLVLKCLEKGPDRRYATAGLLADDLDRWLHGEAIDARPPSFFYRAGKAIRRHMGVVAAAAAAAIGILSVLALGARSGTGWPAAARRLASARQALGQAAGRLDADPAAAAEQAEALALDLERHPGEALPAAQANLLAGLGWRRTQSPKARAAIVRAFQAASRSDDPAEHDAGAEALLHLGEAQGPPHAIRAYRTVLSRFPRSRGAPRARLLLGAAHEANADFPAALGGGPSV